MGGLLFLPAFGTLPAVRNGLGDLMTREWIGIGRRRQHHDDGERDQPDAGGHGEPDPDHGLEGSMDAAWRQGWVQR